MNAVILYASYSGNTEEVAELIHKELKDKNVKSDIFEITETSQPVQLNKYDLIFFGTFTWDQGYVPDFVKDYIADIGYKPNNVATFGTGDTQFGGEEIYCAAVKKLNSFYNSPWPPLLIEQSPRGSQEETVKQWTKETLDEYSNSLAVD